MDRCGSGANYRSDVTLALQRFDTDGGLLFVLGEHGSGPGQFNNPAGFTIGDEDSAIYVLDAGNSRIQKFSYPSAVAVGDDPSSNGLSLSATPNPSSGQTNISFNLARTGPAVITVYDVGGRQLRHWDVSNLAAGRHKIAWDGMTDDGVSVSSSVVFYRLQTDVETISRQLVRLK